MLGQRKSHEFYLWDFFIFMQPLMSYYRITKYYKTS